MTNEHSYFFQAIINEPESDAPRLRYADFLEEQGDEANSTRAEFIRVQCALEKLPSEDIQFNELFHRERLLLEHYWRKWLWPTCQALNEPLPIRPHKPEPQKGFWGWWNRIRGKEKIPIPVRDNYLFDWGERGNTRKYSIKPMREGQNGFSYLQSLRFRRGFIDYIELNSKAYRGTTHLARMFDKTPLTQLVLWNFDPATIGFLAKSGYIERLRHLALDVSYPGALNPIVELPNCSRLTSLKISGYPSEDAGRLLAQSAYLRSLQTLILSDIPLSNEGLRALMESPVLASVKTLLFERNQLGDELAYALVESPMIDQIEQLIIWDNWISQQGEEELRDRFGPRVQFNLNA